MKRSHFIFIVSLPVLLCFTSCKTSRVVMDVLKPAVIDMPEEVNRLAVINRSLAARDQKAQNIVEGLLTGEGVYNDRVASHSCIKGFAESIAEISRFTVVQPELDMRGTGTAVFPPPVPWDEVQSIADEYEVDMIVFLETYDSDILREDEGVNEKRMEAKIESGWRIYDPVNQRIFDQNKFIDFYSWELDKNRGFIPLGGLASKVDAMSEAGYYAGQQYAGRISPAWKTVIRTYYRKGNADFKLAEKLVKANRYDDAAIIWNKYVNHNDPEIAGAACFNMALANEVAGNFESAIEWARKSLHDYGNKNAPGYLNILELRLQEQSRLKEQLRE